MKTAWRTWLLALTGLLAIGWLGVPAARAEYGRGHRHGHHSSYGRAYRSYRPVDLTHVEAVSGIGPRPGDGE